jgi:hypothetical protein
LEAGARIKRETAAGAGPIVDDERRRVVLHPFDQHSGNHVDYTAGAKAHQHARSARGGGSADRVREDGGKATGARQR